MRARTRIIHIVEYIIVSSINRFKMQNSWCRVWKFLTFQLAPVAPQAFRQKIWRVWVSNSKFVPTNFIKNNAVYSWLCQYKHVIIQFIFISPRQKEKKEVDKNNNLKIFNSMIEKVKGTKSLCESTFWIKFLIFSRCAQFVKRSRLLRALLFDRAAIWQVGKCGPWGHWVVGPHCNALWWPRFLSGP